MTDIPQNERIVFYAAKRHARTWKMAAWISLIPVFFFLPAMAAVKGIPPHGRSGVPYFFAVILTVFVLVMFCTAVARFIAGAVEEYRIDDEGVSLPGRLVPWSKLTWIGASAPKRNGRVFISVSGHRPPIVRVPLKADEPLPPREFSEVMNRLRPWLQDHAPHVQIGMLGG